MTSGQQPRKLISASTMRYVPQTQTRAEEKQEGTDTGHGEVPGPAGRSMEIAPWITAVAPGRWRSPRCFYGIRVPLPITKHGVV